MAAIVLAAVRPAAKRSRQASGVAGAAVLLLLASVTRLPSFAFSVLDWDESLYFIMAEQWRAGRLPYTAIWDNKPVGVYAILAAFQAAFGDTIASMRLAGLAATTATAWLVALLAWRLAGRPRRGWCGLLAGCLFVLASVADDGLASNAELFMVVFVCAGVLALLGRAPGGRIGAGAAGLAGLCFGAACMIKYVAVFDAAAAFAVLAAMRMRPRAPDGWRAELAVAALFGCGMALPFAATLALYWRHGQLGVLVDASLLSYLRRGAVPFSLSRLLSAFAHQARLCPPLAIAAAALAARLWRDRGRASLLLLAWTTASALGATAGGFYYTHYFLQMLPPLCVAAGVLAARVAASLPGPPAAAALAVAALALAQPAAAAWGAAAAMLPTVRRSDGGIGLLRDTPARIAHDLRPLLTHAAGETVYVYDAQPILYSLLGVTPPTRFVLPSLLITRFMARVAGVDPAAELAAIMALHPVFVICSLPPRRLSGQVVDLALHRQLDHVLAERYRTWKTYADSIVYRIDPE